MEKKIQKTQNTVGFMARKIDNFFPEKRAEEEVAEGESHPQVEMAQDQNIPAFLREPTCASIEESPDGMNQKKTNADDLLFARSLMEEKLPKRNSNDISKAIIKLEENLKKLRKEELDKKRGTKNKKPEPAIGDPNRPPKKVEEIIDSETLAEILKKYKPIKPPFADRQKIRNIAERVDNIEKNLEKITDAVNDPNFGKEAENIVIAVKQEPVQPPQRIFQPKQYHSSMAMAMQEMLCDNLAEEAEAKSEIPKQQTASLASKNGIQREEVGLELSSPESPKIESREDAKYSKSIKEKIEEYKLRNDRNKLVVKDLLERDINGDYTNYITDKGFDIRKFANSLELDASERNREAARNTVNQDKVLRKGEEIRKEIRENKMKPIPPQKGKDHEKDLLKINNKLDGSKKALGNMILKSKRLGEREAAEDDRTE